MWFLFYLALNSPIGTIQPFKDYEACETFRKELGHKITIKQSACLRFDPAICMPVPPAVIEDHHDEPHSHEGGR